jgi:hypothetical protein
MTGTLHLTSANLPETYEPAPELLEKLVPFQFSKRLTDYHCKICGSILLGHFWRDASDHSKGAQWDAMSGSLENFDGDLEFNAHEFIADTLDGGFSDFLPSVNGKELPRHAYSPRDSDSLPPYWQSKDRPQIKPSSEDKLYCHCKCSGVEFWIARPSERSKQASREWPDLLIPYHSNQPRPDKSTWWLQDNGTKFLAGVCSCNSCRLDTGMEWCEWMFVPIVDISLDAEGKKPFEVPFGTMKAYKSSEGVERFHCGVCGATVFFTCEGREGRKDIVDVGVGLLDAAEGARAESWLKWETGRVSFREDAVTRAESITVAVEEGLKKYEERRNK